MLGARKAVTKMDALSHWDSLTKPMPQARTEIDFLCSFSLAEVETLKRGLIPQQMEDKWFGILRHDALDFYRSWTGHHIYHLSVEKRADGLDAWPLVVNSDPAQYIRHSDLYEMDTIRMLIRWMLQESA